LKNVVADTYVTALLVWFFIHHEVTKSEMIMIYV